MERLELNEFDMRVPELYQPRNPHYLIEKIAHILANAISREVIRRHLHLLLDELIQATDCTFYVFDLPYLIEILHYLADSVDSNPDTSQFERILLKCRIPPMLRKPTEAADYGLYIEGYFSCLGYVLLCVHEHEALYDPVFEALHNALNRDQPFPINCVTSDFCLQAIVNSRLATMIGELCEIVEGDFYIKLIEFAHMLVGKSNRVCLNMLRTGILDYIFFKFAPDWKTRDTYLPITDQHIPYSLDNIDIISTFVMKLMINMRTLSKEEIDTIESPSVPALWSLRAIFRLLVYSRNQKVNRNNIVVIVLIFLEKFQDIYYVHSGLADDVSEVFSYKILPRGWAGDFKFTNEDVDYQFYIQLLLCTRTYCNDVSFVRVIDNYKIVQSLVNILIPDENKEWHAEQYSKLVKLSLECLSRMFPNGIKDFIACHGPIKIINILKYTKENVEDPDLIKACCKTIVDILILNQKTIIHMFVRNDITNTLIYILRSYLVRHYLVIEQKLSISQLIVTIAEVFKHHNVCTDELYEVLDLILKRVLYDTSRDLIYNPYSIIAALDLLSESILWNEIYLAKFIQGGGVYLLVDLLIKYSDSVKLVILTILVNMCEEGSAIPFLLTWRTKGKTLMQILLEMFRKESIAMGGNIYSSGLIKDLEYPIIGEFQKKEALSKAKSLDSSPCIIDMIGSCQPKIYAILYLLKYRNEQTVELINEQYQIWNTELDIQYKIILVVCESYMKLKLGEAWVEVQRDIEMAGLVPTGSDIHLVDTMVYNHYHWTDRLKKIQRRLLLEEKRDEYVKEQEYYQKIKHTKLSLSLESLKELQYISETSDSIFMQMRKMRHRNSLHESEIKLHKTYMEYFNINSVCNQKVTIDTDKLVESKKDWEIDFSDLKDVSPQESLTHFAKGDMTTRTDTSSYFSECANID